MVVRTYRVIDRLRAKSRRRAFTLVELLTVIAIIGVLVALLAPAIQSAREAARVSTCQANLRQIGLAVQNHLDAQGHFPTGGWGFAWTGDPDRGFGRKQPGGWIYNLLPYLEQAPLHDLGAGLSDSGKMTAAASRMETPLTLFACPTRRSAIAYAAESYKYASRLINSDPPQRVARSDYAINVGTSGQIDFTPGGPKSYEDAAGTFEFPDPRDYNGLSFAASTVAAREVSGGMSYTLLAGEKYLNANRYETSPDQSDWGQMYSGLARDICRLGGQSFPLVRDAPGTSLLSLFGGPHLSCQFVRCDASVRPIDYEIDPIVYQQLADRTDE